MRFAGAIGAYILCAVNNGIIVIEFYFGAGAVSVAGTTRAIIYGGYVSPDKIRTAYKNIISGPQRFRAVAGPAR